MVMMMMMIDCLSKGQFHTAISNTFSTKCHSGHSEVNSGGWRTLYRSHYFTTLPAFSFATHLISRNKMTRGDTGEARTHYTQSLTFALFAIPRKPCANQWCRNCGRRSRDDMAQESAGKMTLSTKGSNNESSSSGKDVIFFGFVLFLHEDVVTGQN